MPIDCPGSILRQHPFQLRQSGLSNRCQRAILFQQLLLPLGSHPRNAIQFRVSQALAAQLTVVGDGKAMRFLLDIPDQRKDGLIIIDPNFLALRSHQGPSPVTVVFHHAENRKRQPQLPQDAHSHIGLQQTGTREVDHNEKGDPITPQMRAIDAINPMDSAFHNALAAGITGVMAGPGSANPIGGQFAFIKTVGRCIDDMVVLAPAAIKIAFGENPMTCYGSNGKSKQGFYT